MNRGNYRNITNNFVQGGTYNQHQQEQQHRQTRSQNMPQQPSLPIKTEKTIIPPPTPPTPAPQQPSQPQVIQPIATVVTTPPTPMKTDEPANGLKTFSEDDLMKLKKINFKKKVTGKEKRVRQNKKLYRMLTPRNAIAALNELHGNSINETKVVPFQGNKFEAEIIINNVKYQGVGSSKMSAKNAACEKALRDLVINKYQQAKNQDTGSNEDVNMEETDSSEVPMLQLASFALHKLFSEWEAEGYEIPFPKVTPENVAATATPAQGVEVSKNSPKPPKIRTELPPNNLQMHPVMLLSVMRPCTQYSDLSSQGVTPNIMHTVGATVDGQSFLGQGRSKKEARKRVATEILIKLFDWKGSCC